MPPPANAPAGVIASDFDRIVELYEKLQSVMSDRASTRLVKLAKIAPGQRVLDIGTGTGSAALAAGRLVGRRGSVTGIDVSNGMLSVARRKASASGLSNVRFEVMDASSLNFPDGSFDAVISNLGIPTYSFRDAISEVFMVLEGGGTFCFAEFTRLSPAWSSLSRILSKFAVKKPPPELNARRKARGFMAKEAAKFRLASFSKILRDAGFIGVRSITSSFTAPQPPSEIYLEYLIKREQLEYDAMSETSREEFRVKMTRRLESLRLRSGGRMERHVRYWLARKPRQRLLDVGGVKPLVVD